MSAWFPRYSPSGTRLAWGEDEVWVDGVPIGPGTSPHWLDEQTVLYTRQPDGALMSWPSGEVVRPAGFNDVDACAGRWAGWRAAGDAITWSDGPMTLDGRQPRLGRTSQAYVRPAAGVWEIVRDGSVLHQAAVRDLRMSPDGHLVWAQPADGRWETWGARAGRGPERLHAEAGDEFWPVPLDTPGGPWLLTHSHTRLTLRPWGQTVGVVVHEGVTDYPDVAWTPAGRQVAWSVRGVLAQALVPHEAPLVDLTGAPTPEPPPIPDPEPEPEPTMWTGAHAEVLRRFAAKFPCPGGVGQDEEARSWTRKVAEQFAYEFPSQGWGHKRADHGRPPSTDVIATRSPFIGYDLILGQGTAGWSINSQPSPLPLDGQVFIAVTPTDHLWGLTPEPPQPPTPPPSGDLAALTQRVTALETWAKALAYRG